MRDKAFSELIGGQAAFVWLESVSWRSELQMNDARRITEVTA